jgi:hypothetical protein
MAWCGSIAGIAGLLGLILIIVLGGTPGSQKPKGDPRRAIEKVDAIVNRNKPPTEVSWTGDMTKRAALFPEEHDWAEEARVREAVSVLNRDQTEAVWEEMVKRCRDQRYCETVTSVKTGDAHIKSVGTICDRLAHSRLVGVFWQHLPLNPSKDGEKLWLDVGIQDLTDWRTQRADKALFELQIEVCEKTIEALSKVASVPQSEKDQARKKIEAEIAKLKKSRQPVHEQGGHTFEERGRYNAELAKRVRDGVKSGQYGDLGIIK